MGTHIARHHRAAPQGDGRTLRETTMTDTSAQPLFYRRPEPLSAERHGALKLAAGDFRFASDTNAAPLTAAEFVAAARAYPIVFAREDGWPLALLGLGQGNRQVDPVSGAWAADLYVPAYVRRYPFVFIAQDDRLVLAVDMESARLSEAGEGRPLFEEGEPSVVTREALAFCGEFQAAHQDTRAFVAALAEHNLLVDRAANIRMKEGGERRMGGFRVIDPARWAALKDEVALQFRKAGWDQLAHAHFWSLDRFDFLLTQERGAMGDTPAQPRRKKA